MLIIRKFGDLDLLEWILDVTQIIIADIVLSGDNALIIGMAAAAVPVSLGIHRSCRGIRTQVDIRCHAARSGRRQSVRALVWSRVGDAGLVTWLLLWTSVMVATAPKARHATTETIVFAFSLGPPAFCGNET